MVLCLFTSMILLCIKITLKPSRCACFVCALICSIVCNLVFCFSYQALSFRDLLFFQLFFSNLPLDLWDPNVSPTYSMVDLRKIWIELDGNWTGEGKITYFFSFFFYAKKKKKRPDFVRAAQHPAASCFGCYALFI